LLVEDNPINQQVAAGLLRRHGVNPAVASNGVEALDALIESRFDLVLMDVQMPVLDGLATTRAIRRGEGGEQHVKVPIVAMTANAMQGDRENSLAAGMDDYLTKPISAAKIAALLDRWQPHHPRPGTQEDSRRVFDAPLMRDRLQLDEQLVREIVQLFAGDLPARRRSLVEAWASSRFDEMQRLAHTLKGTAANLVAQGVVDAAHELETTLEAGEQNRFESSYQTLLKEIDRLQDALLDFLR
jgi:CheY-like chemotaxis protein/HPt (histidine-containing phosphotransfer) domain-containing protein